MVGGATSKIFSFTPEISAIHKELSSYKLSKECLWKYVERSYSETKKIPTTFNVSVGRQNAKFKSTVSINECVALYIFPTITNCTSLHHDALRILLLHSRGEEVPEIADLDQQKKIKILKAATQLGYIWKGELERQFKLNYVPKVLPKGWECQPHFANCCTYEDVLSLLMKYNDLKLYLSFLNAVMLDAEWNKTDRERIITALTSKIPLNYFDRLHFFLPMHNEDFFFDMMEKEKKYADFFIFMVENELHKALNDHYIILVRTEMKLRASRIMQTKTVKAQKREIAKANNALERIHKNPLSKEQSFAKELEEITIYLTALKGLEL